MGFIYSFDERFNKIQKSINSVSIYRDTLEKIVSKTRHMDIYIILALYKIKFYFFFEFSQTFPFCSSILT